MADSGGTNTITEKNTEPWKEQQPYLQEMFKEAQRLYRQKGPEYYSGPTLAPVAPETQQGLDYARALASGWGMNLAGSTAGASDYLLNQARDVTNNPMLAKAVEGAVRPITQAHFDAGGTMSQIRSGAGQAGQYGGTRQGVAEGIASGRYYQTLGDVTSKMMSDAYNEGLGATSKGLALLPQTQTGLSYPATVWSAVGDTSRGLEQQFINEAIQRWNYEQQLPYNKLATYQNLVQGNYGMTGQGTAQGPAPQGNALAGAIGGAATGAGLYSMLAGPAASFGPYGWLALGAGALLGGSLS